MCHRDLSANNVRHLSDGTHDGTHKVLDFGVQAIRCAQGSPSRAGAVAKCSPNRPHCRPRGRGPQGAATKDRRASAPKCCRASRRTGGTLRWLSSRTAPRPLEAGWIANAHGAGIALSAVITPWALPYGPRGGSGLTPGVANRGQELRGARHSCAGVAVWFDARTHALQMRGGGRRLPLLLGLQPVGGLIRDLSQDACRREHVRRVFKHQAELSASMTAPAPLLPLGLNNVNTLALDTLGSPSNCSRLHG